MTDWLPGTKNDNGVYCPKEVLRLPRDVKGWRGMDRVKITLVETPEGWRSALSYAFFTGGWEGGGYAVSDVCKAHPKRQGAIDEQIEAVRQLAACKIGRVEEKEAREMLAWAESLNPDQMDLFGDAA